MRKIQLHILLCAALAACIPAWRHAHAGPVESIIEDWISEGISPPAAHCSADNDNYLGHSTDDTWVENQLAARCQQATANAVGIAPLTVYACYSSTIEDDDFSGSLEPRVVCFCDNFFCNQGHSEVFEETLDTILGISDLLS